MHYDVAAIDQYPFAGLFAFDANDVATGFLDLFAYVIGQCLDLAVGVAAGDDQAFEQRAEFAHVQGENVLGLDVFQGIDGEFFQVFSIHAVLRLFRYIVSGSG